MGKGHPCGSGCDQLEATARVLAQLLQLAFPQNDSWIDSARPDCRDYGGRRSRRQQNEAGDGHCCGILWSDSVEQGRDEPPTRDGDDHSKRDADGKHAHP